ncbi:hypothetical protein LINPERHAP1_LOCUS35230 [Linum perenne]
MSHIVLSTASKDSLCIIDASSHTIRVALLSSSATSDPFFTVHIDRLSISRGILNRECPVTPSGKRVAAIPDDAMTNEIPPVLLTFEIVQLYKNIFPVPP